MMVDPRALQPIPGRIILILTGDVNEIASHEIASPTVSGKGNKTDTGTIGSRTEWRNEIMRISRILVLSVLLFLGLNVIACSGSLFRNYGRILPNETVDQDLEGNVVHPEYRYYTSGSDLYPNAFIGLHRDYHLDRETLWKEVAMSPEKLREIVYFMKAKAYEFRQFPHGFDLIDTEGKKIGFWYSIFMARTFIRFEEDGTVMILTPELETYEKLEKETKD
jgi:hypothetical protein